MYKASLKYQSLSVFSANTLVSLGRRWQKAGSNSLIFFFFFLPKRGACHRPSVFLFCFVFLLIPFTFERLHSAVTYMSVAYCIILSGPFDYLVILVWFLLQPCFRRRESLLYHLLLEGRFPLLLFSCILVSIS